MDTTHKNSRRQLASACLAAASLLAVVLLPTVTVAKDAEPASELSVWRPPSPGTQYKLQVEGADGTKVITYSVVQGPPPYKGRPVVHISDGNEVNVYDAATGNLLAKLDDHGNDAIVLSPDSGEFSWPLTVGKRWLSRYSYEDRKRGRSWPTVETWWKVEAVEDVTVPAGTFKAIRLQSDPGENNATRATLWYAPELGTVIKSVFERLPYHYLGPSKQTSELLDFKRP